MLTPADIAAVAFAVLVTLPSAYLAFLAAVTFFPRSPQRRGDDIARSLRFAILVPAHDEELLIGRTVASIFRLRYPVKDFSVHVVADNCVDGTAVVARSAGACVHERHDSARRGKGAALNWLIDAIASETGDVDAFVVIDADTELSGDFLAVMAGRLRSGAEAVQALNLAAASKDRPLVRIRELRFELVCHLRPLAYEILGGSSGLYGNGMCFDARLLRGYRWSESSTTEDGELFMRLVRDGHRVALATDATVRSVMPATFGQARSQALRWERTRFTHTLDAARLVWRGARHRDPSALFAGLGVLLPPVALLGPLSALALVGGLLAGATALAALAGGSLLALLGYALRGAMLGRMTPRTVLRILLWAPAYAAWALWMIALAGFGVGRGEWTRTTRVAG